MRAMIGAIILGTGLGLGSVPSTVAASVGVDVLRAGGPKDVVEHVQFWGDWRGRYCERLRRACASKHERGEEGYGHCRRYREECLGRRSYCERLRRACASKHERGEEGYGHCRRYREECGRR